MGSKASSSWQSYYWTWNGGMKEKWNIGMKSRDKSPPAKQHSNIEATPESPPWRNIGIMGQWNNVNQSQDHGFTDAVFHYSKIPVFHLTKIGVFGVDSIVGMMKS